MNNVKQIADLLPEGLDESTVESIFQLVDSTINEQVQSQVRILESKVTAYLRTKVEDLKTQALTELSEESEVFRNARLFESVRTLMSLELSDQDEENALSEMSNNYGEMQEECDVLVEQVNRLVEENEKLQGTVKVLDNKVSITEASIEELEGVNGKLLYEVENLEASKDEAFVSSEKAPTQIGR